jgi:hypothetical protein
MSATDMISWLILISYESWQKKISAIEGAPQRLRLVPWLGAVAFSIVQNDD